MSENAKFTRQTLDLIYNNIPKTNNKKLKKLFNKTKILVKEYKENPEQLDIKLKELIRNHFEV